MVNSSQYHGDSGRSTNNRNAIYHGSLLNITNSFGEALKMETKSGLTLRLALYSAEVQRTFVLTYVLFMVVIQCPFPQFADGLGILVQAWGLLQVLLNHGDLNLQVVQRLLKKYFF